MDEAWIAGLAAVVVVLAVVVWMTAVRPGLQKKRRDRAVPAGSPSPIRLGKLAVAVLDVEGAPADSPALQRLVHDRAGEVFSSMPDVSEVEVRTASGTVLARIARTTAAGPGPVSIPSVPAKHAGPDPSRHLGNGEAKLPEQHWEGPAVGGPTRTFVERYELPEAVVALVRDPDDPVDVVRAVLEAGGRHPTVEGDTIVAGDRAVVVLAPHDGVIRAEALGHAFIRVEGSGAPGGVVVMLGFADLEDVRHREVVAPHVQHVGARAIQRMADAVALGADPLRFAVISAGTRGHEPATA